MLCNDIATLKKMRVLVICKTVNNNILVKKGSFFIDMTEYSKKKNMNIFIEGMFLTSSFDYL